MNEGKVIDWPALAAELGLIASTDGGWTERGGTDHAREAVARILGAEALRASVDAYVAGGPGTELARSVLWLLRPGAATDRCHEIYLTSTAVESRRSAIELLRVVADARVLGWVRVYLADPDQQVQNWAIGIVDQLLFSELIQFDDCAPILDEAESHPNEVVREKARWIRETMGPAEPRGV